MPRFYFSLEGGRPDGESEGTELLDAAAALEETVEAMADMLRDIDGSVWKGGEWIMRITDETGATVGTLLVRGTRGPAA
jgi:hypothetical protein